MWEDDIVIVDDEDNARNARVVREHSGGDGGVRVVRRPSSRTSGVRVVTAAQPQVGSAPWNPQIASPAIMSANGLKLGTLADMAAQVWAAITPLPTAPQASGTVATDLAAIIDYQRKLAEHAKKDEQVRTIGAVARLFLG